MTWARTVSDAKRSSLDFMRTVKRCSPGVSQEVTSQLPSSPYVKGVANLSENARGQMIGETGSLKLLFRREDMKLLGVHLIGEGATELVHIGLLAMMSGATAELFIEACFNYPTLSDAYKYATYDALQRKARA